MRRMLLAARCSGASLVLAFSLLLVLPAQPAAAKKNSRIHVNVAAVELAPKVPPELEAEVKKAFASESNARKAFVASLDGAPGRDKEQALTRWLRKRNIRAYDVTLKLTGYEQNTRPHPQGKRGQVLAVKLQVELVGAEIPSGSLGLTGQGEGQVLLEVGSSGPRPSDIATARTESLQFAVKQALDDAIKRLRH